MTAKDDYTLSAKPIQLRRDGISLGPCTGFIWELEGRSYLITNKHNVTLRNPETKIALHSQCAVPNMLSVQLDLRDPEGFRGPFELPLYDGRNQPERDQPLWLEHAMDDEIDVVAIELPALPGAHSYPINKMKVSPMSVGMGSECFIIGYPSGVNVENFPIWKRASIASELGVTAHKKPYFYVDTATSRGMSGSPVIARTWGLYQMKNGRGQVGNPGSHNSFLGIYSGRTKAKELQVQLGRVWHAHLIEEIIMQNRRGSPVK